MKNTMTNSTRDYENGFRADLGMSVSFMFADWRSLFLCCVYQKKTLIKGYTIQCVTRALTSFRCLSAVKRTSLLTFTEICLKLANDSD